MTQVLSNPIANRVADSSTVEITKTEKLVQGSYQSFFPEKNKRRMDAVGSSKCPCCDYQLLRHIRSNKIYYFCQHCRQEMPSLETVMGL